MYNNLKLQNPHENGALQSHINSANSVAHQSAYPDSTSHLLHTTSTTSHQTISSVDVPISGSYHSNYAFRAGETATATVASVTSTDTDYVINSNVVTSNQNNATTAVLASSTTGLHQRRGSLQLWQFLVALLDEPAAR